MTIKELTGPLESIARVPLHDSSEMSVELHNVGANPLTAFQVKFYSTSHSLGTVWFDTASQFTAPATNGIIRGNNNTLDPTTLAPGAFSAFIFVNMESFHSVEFLASSSGATEVELYVGSTYINVN